MADKSLQCENIGLILILSVEKIMRLKCWRIALLSTACGLSIADEPLPPPIAATICNAANTHCATTDPAARNTRLVERPTGTVLWSLHHYIRFFQISNDGQAILSQSDWSSAAPLDATNQHILFVIYRHGKPIQTVPLGALFKSASELQRTVSHLSWGYLEKIDTQDNAVFVLVDGRRVSYSLVTGCRVSH